MPRISIYISEDLKRRMDKVNEDRNWSKIASKAFEESIRSVDYETFVKFYKGPTTVKDKFNAH